MSMNAALSGLSAAQADISTISNNIANVSTIGFRGSRVEFADVFNSSPYTTSNTTVGAGTQVVSVSANFAQGNIVTTGNRLDLAIEGQGFFAVQSGGTDPNVPTEVSFTRAGEFEMDAQGTITNSAGQALLGWPVAADGSSLNASVDTASPITIPPTMGTAVGTTEISLGVDFPMDAALMGQQDAVPPSAAFDPADPTTYAQSTAVPMRDATGAAQDATIYYVKTAQPDGVSTDTSYEAHLMVNGVEQTAAPQPVVTFDANGVMTAPAGAVTFGSGASAMAVDMTGSKMADGNFTVATASDNGKGVSSLSSLEIDGTGTIYATYGSEDRVALGKVMLATFPNPSGLRVLGNSSFAATANSGPVTVGAPSSQGFGLIRAGALESANVDLTQELVNLISAQRNYQASSKALETSNNMMSTIMAIRS
jgi:flagellar hook protein FlgE